MTAWLFLVLAAGFEIVFALAMKASEGFSRLMPSVLTLVAGGISVVFLTMAMKSMPVSLAYPAWTAMGTLGAVILGAALFGEPLGLGKILATAALVGGVAGLQVSS
ncbi:quaternary ammonium compound-resistance protein SugE [Ancylobacter sp. 3268]|uniref:DMT family transporter n=1 Tax=Ancylobacter sp. 3268 TaxID=2817752 RepID=UPI0028571B0F|nr:multidrug efflux SMR transporter [Ancylobacter sp. 3268]MDR6951072.1 quaternary ammonium compound-resistance protein SugE [Ancylobacter sp. 3268]